MAQIKRMLLVFPGYQQPRGLQEAPVQVRRTRGPLQHPDQHTQIFRVQGPHQDHCQRHQNHEQSRLLRGAGRLLTHSINYLY